MNPQKVVLAAVAALLFAYTAGSFVYATQRAEQIAFMSQENAELFVRPYSQTQGPEDARVYLVEFFDPACETCAQFSRHVHDLLAKHPGKIRLVQRYAPFHPGSDYVVKMLEASRKQGKYWETLDVMFATQSAWASHSGPKPELLWGYLAKVGVDVRQLQADMADPALDAIVQQDLADAAALGVRMTPEFFVNGKPMPSFGLAQLQTLVETEVAAAY